MADLKQSLGITFIVATHNMDLLQVASYSYKLADGLLEPTFTG
jgi:ABC-type lipoprotein export system ATPase subunit